MDEKCFESALKSLTKTQHKRRFLQILLAIREGVNSPERARKLHKAGSLKYIVSCLQQDCRKAVDIALSILGNCSYLDFNCSKSLVQQHKLLPTLCQLLEKYDDDSIRGRVFRILGNLSDVTLSTHILERESAIIAKTVDFLRDDSTKEVNTAEEGATTEATINMALRTLRKFVTKNTLDILLTQFEVLKAVGMSLIKFTNLWESSGNYGDVINEIIKIILLYSNYKHVACISQLKNTSAGDALACLSKLVLKFPERVIKIIVNFFKTCSLKSDIPVEDIAQKLMKGINDSKNESEGTVDILYLKSLCKICDEVSCRDQIKSANVIPYLVGILKYLKPGQQKSYEHFHCILSSAITCKYDYSLVSAQVKSGIIKVLTETLQVMYGKSSDFKSKHKCKRQQPSWKQRTENKKSKKPLDEVVSYKKDNYTFLNAGIDKKTAEIEENKQKSMKRSMDYETKSWPACSWLASTLRFEVHTSLHRLPLVLFDFCCLLVDSCTKKGIESDVSMDWSAVYNSKDARNEHSPSPSSSSDDMSSSPNSPHYPIFADGDDLSDSDNYSPICSDTEDTSTSEIIPEEDIGNPSENETNEHIKELSRNKNSVHFLVKQEIHSLLKWYTTVKPTITELTDPNLIITLTKAATDLTDPFHSSFSLLLNILSIQECLLPLMVSDYIPSVYALTIYDHENECTVCLQLEDKAKLILAKLKKLAESGGGRGEIAHILLRSKDQTKKEKIVLAIPYIIGNKSILRNLLVNCEGMDIIMDILKTNEKYKELCVRGICEIASTQLKIKSPADNEQTKPVINYQEKQFSLPKNCSNIVTFKLDDGSLVKADRDFLSENCDYFNRLLSGHFKESQESVINLPNVNSRALHIILIFMTQGISKSLYKFAELNLVLEAISLADQFILLELSVFLAECVEQNHLSAKTIPEIYRWSIESGTNFLRVECIAFALVGELSPKERYNMFQKLLEFGYSDVLADDIKCLLTQFLGQCS